MQAQVLRPDVDGKMRFSYIASSDGRRWSGFEASLYDISPGISERSPSAAHTIVLHLSSPVDGTCRCEGPLLRRTIQTGDIDFVPAGYAATWHDNGPGRVANVRVSPALMRTTATALGHSDALALELPARLSLNDPVLRHLTLAIVSELQSGDNGPLFAESIGTAIATHLLQHYAQLQSSGAPRGLSSRQLARVLDYIDSNLATTLTLADIAIVAGISASHLKTLFKQSIGTPVHQYVIRQRVDLAVRLLSCKGIRLCDVAQQAGFSDQSHMARCMQRVIGATPAMLVRDILR